MEIKKERNYGIDLLRIVSMFFIVILHTLGRGGVLDNAKEGSVQYVAAWLLEVFAFVAVDIFALISGYVMYSDKPKSIKRSRYVLLWLEVVFYGVVGMLICGLFEPEWVTKGNVLMQFLPVTNNLYWYFTAYTALFLLLPFLNSGLRAMSKETAKKMLVIIFLGFSVFGCIVGAFQLNSGYSAIWIILIYIMGAIMKKCEIGKNIKTKGVLFGILGLIGLAFLWRMFGPEFEFFNVKITKGLFVSYISPMILGASMLYVIGFSRLKFKKKWLIKMIIIGASGSFAVYLLNCHMAVWKFIMGGNFAWLANENVVLLVGVVIGFSMLFTTLAILIDWARLKLFEVMRLKMILSRIKVLD